MIPFSSSQLVSHSEEEVKLRGNPVTLSTLWLEIKTTSVDRVDP